MASSLGGPYQRASGTDLVPPLHDASARHPGGMSYLTPLADDHTVPPSEPLASLLEQVAATGVEGEGKTP